MYFDTSSPFTSLGPVAYSALGGALDKDAVTHVPCGGKVELSDISRCDAESVPQRVLALKYVAQGTEIYRYAGRVHKVQAGSFLLLPPGHHGEVSMDRAAGNAVGMCVYLRAAHFPQEGNTVPDEPLVFPASASALGRKLASGHAQLHSRPPDGQRIAQALLDAIEDRIEAFSADALRAIAAFTSVKASTRYENFRRTSEALSYLHDNCDRVVSLAELASACGLSQFQLARLFADRFGEPPSTYHRRLRLRLARREIAEDRLSCSEAAYRYGFTDPAHFSRAHRKTFGFSPSQAAG